jgi:hypothetical protein
VIDQQAGVFSLGKPSAAPSASPADRERERRRSADLAPLNVEAPQLQIGNVRASGWAGLFGEITCHSRGLVIGIQNRPTSACKMDPPGFRGTLVERLFSGVALVSRQAPWLRCRRRVKRRRALRGRNLPRDNPADGVPPGTWLRGSNHACGVFFAPGGHRSSCRKKSWGSGGKAPSGAKPPRAASRALAQFFSGSALRFFFDFIDSRKR